MAGTGEALQSSLEFVVPERVITQRGVPVEAPTDGPNISDPAQMAAMIGFAAKPVANLLLAYKYEEGPMRMRLAIVAVGREQQVDVDGAGATIEPGYYLVDPFGVYLSANPAHQHGYVKLPIGEEVVIGRHAEAINAGRLVLPASVSGNHLKLHIPEGDGPVMLITDMSTSGTVLWRASATNKPKTTVVADAAGPAGRTAGGLSPQF